MESGGGTAHQKADGNNRFGTNAGLRGRAACGGDVSDTKANWDNSSSVGSDDYGFRVLPAGWRREGDSFFSSRSYFAFFWTSSAKGSANAVIRGFSFANANVYRVSYDRSYGQSVRCIKN
jgi:uncharacterized protein (TIGR02145 family)